MKFMKALLRLYYQMYIRWNAIQWVLQTNLGDLVIHKGRRRTVCNGVVSGRWTLSDPYEEFVPREECRKVLTVGNLYRSYKSGVWFYTTNWLDIWVNEGITAWMRHLPIWPRWGKAKR